MKTNVKFTALTRYRRKPRQVPRYLNELYGRPDEAADDDLDFPDEADFGDEVEVADDFDIPEVDEAAASAPAAKIRPPVKWHGGKFHQFRRIVEEFGPHRIYVEPFGGGASVLLNKPPVDVEVYNDLDLRITRLFRVLRDQGEALVNHLRLTPYSQVEFRDAATYPPGATELQKAACDYIRWRQSFGGQGKSWSYTTTRARGGKAGDVNAWWTGIEQLTLSPSGSSGARSLASRRSTLSAALIIPEALFYCDPTYVASTRSSPDVYGVEMTDGDHRELAGVLNECRGKVVLSGYPSPLYDELYSGWKRVEYDAPKHSAGGKSKARATEVLWKNF